MVAFYRKETNCEFKGVFHTLVDKDVAAEGAFIEINHRLPPYRLFHKSVIWVEIGFDSTIVFVL